MPSGTWVPFADLDVKAVQRCRVGLEVLSHFHHHVVLVQLGEDCGNLPLTECIVERVVDVGHRDAQARSGVAIDHQLGPQALILQVAGYVGNDLFLGQFLHHQPRVSGQFVLVRVLQRILELRAADAIFHRQILQRLQKELNPVNRVHLRL